MRRLSVVMPNYNYEDFVGAAIESALAVDWPDVEVIVVDDGSTDGSRAIIEGFGSRITAIFQDNSGPRVACNAGYEASTGDVVIFLDSDDMVEPSIARELAAVWREGISKVQFPMIRVDRDGEPTGGVYPDLDPAPSPEQVRTWMRATGAYPTPPGSGNAYAREFLARLFPVGDRCGDATDSSTLAAAPFLGDVVTLTTPLVRYREHGANRSYLLAEGDRFRKQLERAYQRHLFALDISGHQEDGMRPLFRGRHLLQLRVAHHRLHPGERPIPGDSGWRMARDACTSPFAPGPESATHRLMVAAWSLAVLASPRPLARRLIDARFRQGAADAVRRRTATHAARPAASA
ncbi:glycosyltransferase family 2 protein [Demequina activiva]|uniref:Glycosyl transferase n=1 Tax=Demequina activiva TaxID=1582364 RepID=A0A919UK76_9MICO|nr:glycosyltransferase family A protein [Demequina activiva]GIG53428.1 glycosyl transferase [Demequina activiva]